MQTGTEQCGNAEKRDICYMDLEDGAVGIFKLGYHLVRQSDLLIFAKAVESSCGIYRSNQRTGNWLCVCCEKITFVCSRL